MPRLGAPRPGLGKALCPLGTGGTLARKRAPPRLDTLRLGLTPRLGQGKAPCPPGVQGGPPLRDARTPSWTERSVHGPSHRPLATLKGGPPHLEPTWPHTGSLKRPHLMTAETWSTSV